MARCERVLSFLIKAEMTVIARTPENGAETLVFLATNPEVGATTGEYFFDRKVARTTAAARDATKTVPRV